MYLNSKIEIFATPSYYDTFLEGTVRSSRTTSDITTLNSAPIFPPGGFTYLADNMQTHYD